MQVSIRDLKANLSKYLVRARRGEGLEITSHRKVVARIIGIPEADDGVRRLLAQREATWDGGKPKGAMLCLKDEGKALSEIVLYDRG